MKNDEQVDQSLEATALWTASARAQESARSDYLFQDPWAASLAGDEGMAWLQKRGGNVAAMVIRTHYFDGFLQSAVQEGGIHQVVILAAGLDTRAYRLDWPRGTRLFELERPAVLQQKAQVLANAKAEPRCERIAIPADLAGNWTEWLSDGGFDQKQSSVWLLEGILFYLPEAKIMRILEQVSSLSAHDSQLGFDIVNHLTLTSPITQAWIEMQAKAGAPWVGWMDDPENFLNGLGWRPAMTQPGSADAHFGRWTLPVIPVKMPNMPHNWYVTAVKI